MSQELLGSKAGLHYTYIGAVERAEKNITLESIEKIATGLGVDIPTLFYFAEPGKSREKLLSRIVKEASTKKQEQLDMILKIIGAL